MIHKRFITYKDKYDVYLNKNIHEGLIYDILVKSKRVYWINLISAVSLRLFVSDSSENLIEVQKKIFDWKFNEILVHRRGLLTLAQYIYQIPNSEFSLTNNATNLDCLNLFLSINEILNILEDSINTFSTSRAKKTFFFYFRIMPTMLNTGDIQASNQLFNRIYDEIAKSKFQANYNEIVFSATQYQLLDLRKIINEIVTNGMGKEILNLMIKLASIKIDDINDSWKNRETKIEIPLDYNFIMRYPFVTDGENHYSLDSISSMYLLNTYIYTLLSENSFEKFKQNFGKEIAEPMLVKYFDELFVENETSSCVKIGNKKIEYGDFGLLSNADIFLFEIKTSIINVKRRNTRNHFQFFNEIEDKLILKSGVGQQVKSLINIDNNYVEFLKTSKLPVDKKFTFYPILVLFDEAFQASRTNWYFNLRYKEILKSKKNRFKHILLSKSLMVITFNEFCFLEHRYSSVKKRLDVLRKFDKRGKNNYDGIRYFSS